MKVLYVCPYAHSAGHYPHVATVEPVSLAKAGHKVAVLTSCGVIGGAPSVKCYRNSRFWHILRKVYIARWFAMMAEGLITFGVALQVKGFDLIHVRDIDPFPFNFPLMAMWAKNKKIVLSTVGLSFVTPRNLHTVKEKIYGLLTRYAVNSPAWIPLFKRLLRRNHVIIVAQNPEIAESWHKVIGADVRVISWGVDTQPTMPQKAARMSLGCPLDKTVVLSFGAPHLGKDLETVIKAVYEDERLALLHGGYSAGLGNGPEEILKRYYLNGRGTIAGRYILESEKPAFFGAADVIALSYRPEFTATPSMLWEAAKYGIPVVASNVGRLGQLVNDYGMGCTFEFGDSNAFAKAVYKTVLHKEEWGKGLAKFQRDYSRDTWAKEYSNLYEELCNK